MGLQFEVIGPYEVVEVLGQGGMGTVYKGLHARSRETVAIKVISEAMAQHARFRRRFDAEIQTLIRLKHPNIVQVIGYGEEHGLLFYSMEYVDGENLHQLLRRAKGFGWEQVLDWSIEICSALKHAHDFGIIHRDLKPANLMINSKGHVKLMDFGIAKLYGSREQTVPGSVLGTADFMAPEQAEGKSVTVRSDLYALGAICYSALAGRTPFTGSNLPEILFNIRYSKLTPLRELSPGTPVEFCNLIEDLLQRDPTTRPPTAVVVLKRLQSLKTALANRAMEDRKTASEVMHAKELTSLDMSDLPVINVSSDKPLENQTYVALGGVVTPSEQELSHESNGEEEDSFAGPNDLTRAEARGNRSQSEEILSGIAEVQNTNFTQVTDQDRKRSSLVLTDEPADDHWGQWLSVAGISAILIACLIAAYWFSRPPSSDSLYDPIASAIASEDDERLEEMEVTARRFLELYPEDSRVADVQEVIEAVETNRLVRQLQRRASNASAANLDAVEQAFLECSDAATNDPVAARKKLQAMLLVFSDRDRLSRRQNQILKAAQKMLARLDETKLESPGNLAVESLVDQMQWAEANLPPDQRSAWLQGLIELYEGKPWAADLIEKAKRKLDAAQGGSQDG